MFQTQFGILFFLKFTVIKIIYINKHAIFELATTHTFTFNMAASSMDFQWYDDMNDKHPIGQGPTQTPLATPSASTGPFNHIQ